jgi:uncharacterized coiled-coil DUF342 family protein
VLRADLIAEVERLTGEAAAARARLDDILERVGMIKQQLAATDAPTDAPAAGGDGEAK